MALDPDFDDFRFGDVKYDPADPQLQPGGSHPLPPLCTNGEFIFVLSLFAHTNICFFQAAC
jgi:hypothetical protein